MINLLPPGNLNHRFFHPIHNTPEHHSIPSPFFDSVLRPAKSKRSDRGLASAGPEAPVESVLGVATERWDSPSVRPAVRTVLYDAQQKESSAGMGLRPRGAANGCAWLRLEREASLGTASLGLIEFNGAGATTLSTRCPTAPMIKIRLSPDRASATSAHAGFPPILGDGIRARGSPPYIGNTIVERAQPAR